MFNLNTKKYYFLFCKFFFASPALFSFTPRIEISYRRIGRSTTINLTDNEQRYALITCNQFVAYSKFYARKLFEKLFERMMNLVYAYLVEPQGYCVTEVLSSF